MHRNPFSVEVPLRTPLGELTTLPKPRSRMEMGTPLPFFSHRRLHLGAFDASLSTARPSIATFAYL